MKKNGKETTYSHFISFAFSILLLLIGFTKISSSIKYPFSYIFDPIHIAGSQMGSTVTNWTTALFDASSYIQEYNGMKEEIARLKVENAANILDLQEYQTLKQHIQVILPEQSYIESKIVKFTDSNEAVINSGSNNGLQKGNSVTFGKVFLGLLSDVDSNSALVRLPTNSLSTYEVVVVPRDIDLNSEFRLDSFVKSTGVVIGDLNQIKIENMGINSEVVDGDMVLIRDEKVDDILILGTLVAVSKNPASTHKNGLVSPIFDYTNILTVFVRND